MRLLDDPEAISRIDSGNMLGAINHFPDLMTDAARIHPVLSFGRSTPFQSVVLMGMGGSASAGDVLLDWLADRIPVPAFVVRDSSIPKFVDKRTLFIAFSYSGNTAETLEAFRLARIRGSTLIGIGSGGTLAKICRQHSVPFLRVVPGLVPRAALSQMVALGAMVLEGFGLVRNIRRDLSDAGKELEITRSQLRVEVPFLTNRAKSVAAMLKGSVPVIYCLQRMSSVARRFKNQLAENSKIVAKYELLPEAGHNEVEAWIVQRAGLVPLMVRDWLESSREKVLFEAFRSTVKRASKVEPLEVRMRATTELGRLLAPILFVDYTSAYLAFLRGVDPTTTPWIREYRKKIQAS